MDFALQLVALVSAITLGVLWYYEQDTERTVDCDVIAILPQRNAARELATALPANVRVTHVSLFDRSLQGIAYTDKPAFSFQGHPEASPGPHDVGPLFDRFVEMMRKA